MKRKNTNKEKVLKAKEQVDVLMELFTAIMEDFINDDEDDSMTSDVRILLCQRALNGCHAKLLHVVNEQVICSLAKITEIENITERIKEEVNGK